MSSRASALYHPDGLAAAKAHAAPGQCIFCEEPLRGLRRVICGSSDCERAMNTTYVRDRRRGAPRVRAPARRWLRPARPAGSEPCPAEAPGFPHLRGD